MWREMVNTYGVSQILTFVGLHGLLSLAVWVLVWVLILTILWVIHLEFRGGFSTHLYLFLLFSSLSIVAHNLEDWLVGRF